MSTPSTQSSKYLDPKTLDRIKRMDVRARLVVEGFVTGQHRSPYHGFAVEFATHREYTPGDDIKHLDWKVWSKTDRLYIKEYEAETNVRCNMIVDCSKSMRYGEQQGWSKFDYAATAAASLSYLLQQQQDAVGLVLFSNQIDRVFRPSTHPTNLRQMLHELEVTQPERTTDVGDVFLNLANQIRQRGMIALFSDLLVDPDVLARALSQFRMRHHEVIIFHIMHNDELTFPFQDNTLFRGLEVDTQLHTEPRALRKSYLEAVERYMAKVRRVCAQSGIDHVLVDTSKPLDGVLFSYLSFRQKRRKQLLKR